MEPVTAIEDGQPEALRGSKEQETPPRELGRWAARFNESLGK